MGWEWACIVEMREVLVVERQEGGRRYEVKAKDSGWNIRKMRKVVELLKEGSDTPRLHV